MKYLTSPRLRAYETERAMKVGADLSGFGRRNIAAERARESALRSLRTILVDAGYYASDQGSNVAQQRVVDPVVREITEKGSAPEENQGLRRPAIPSSDRYTPSNFNPQLIPRDSSVTSAEALRQQEINKLLGVQPTQ